ncbi:hypothetical protein BMG05_14965 [Mycobacterium malmoense]|nr:hypothetical protein BMG05_14965 [Mycobacterium malmoense]
MDGVAQRKLIVSLPRDVAAGYVKAMHDDPVTGCKCGQEHDWAAMVESAHRHDAAERAAGR